jgi:hypothetical protein
MPRSLFHELNNNAGGQPEFSRLIEMGMDIERLLQVGMPGGLNDPMFDPEDLLGHGPMGGMFGGPPIGMRRDQERDFQR